jgi:diacylglycerol kinase family enzyme
MKIPLSPALAIRVLNQDNQGLIDTITLNDKYYIASIAGVGFDAYIARLMQAAKLRGFSAYLNLILREYPSYKEKDYTLVIDGKEIKRKAWFTTFANSNQFGYNAAIAPQAKLDDGLIDISIVDKIPIEHVPITGPLVYANHFELSQHVEMFKANEVWVSGNVDKWVNIDGEGENVGENLHFVNHKQSLKILKRDMKKPLRSQNPAEAFQLVQDQLQMVHDQLMPKKR